MLYRSSGVSNIKELPSAASTALVANGAVVLTSGVLAKAASTDLNIAGIVLQTRASTDSDYASAKPVLVDMLQEGAEVFCDNVTGTLTAAMVGTYLNLSSTAGVVLDAGSSSATEAQFLCVKFVSATSGFFVLNGSALTRPAA